MDVEPKPFARAASRELSRNCPQAYGGSQPSLSPRLKKVTDAAQAEAARLKDEFVSTEHLLLGIASRGRPLASRARCCSSTASRRIGFSRCSRRSAARSASPIRTPKRNTRRSSDTAAISPSWRAAASSIRSSAGTRRSAGSSRCCRGARRTIRCSSASPASARPPSSKGWRAASSSRTCRRD